MADNIISYHRVLKRLDGGRGLVLKGKDTTLGRFATLKFLPEEFPTDLQEFEHFLHEARAAAGIR